MKAPQPQYITDDKGKRHSVILSIKEYERMKEEIEELEDIRLYDKVKARKEPSVPFDEYLRQRRKKKNA